MENEKCRLLEIINESSFALFDIILFLDTHPCDEEALRCYKDYKHIRNAAVTEYESKFGPLRAGSINCDDKFTWVCGPWPWEGGCCR